MRKVLLFLFFLFTSYFIYSQDQIKNIAINTESLKKHIEYLSSKECDGRGIDTPGLDSAANYISTYFKSYGLKSITGANNKEAFYENFYLYKFYDKDINNAVICANNKTLKLYYDFDTGVNDQTTKTEKAEVIFCYDKNILNHCNLKGKFVAILNNKDRIKQEAIIEQIKNKGAKGIIKIRDEDKKSSPEHIALKKEVKYDFNSWSYFLDLNKTEFFTFNMPKSSAATLFNTNLNSFNRNINLYKKGKKNKLSGKSYSFTYNLPKKTDTINVKNVIGIIPGSDLKNEIIVISAHYDHLGKSNFVYFPGADDNASGVSVLLELARIFGDLQKKNITPRRTIAFIAFTAEEQNLLGSKFLLEKDSIININRIIANINVDMVGRGSAHHIKSPNQLYILGEDFNTKLLELPDSINNIYSYLYLDYKYTKDDPKKYFEKSDQFSFINKNIPSIFFFGGTHKDLHTPHDTYDKINFSRLEKVSLLIFHTLWTTTNIDNL